MILDSHCHLKHGNKERTEHSPRAIVQVMDGAGIDKSVVFAMCVSSAEATRFAQKAAREFPERLIPYAYAIPHIAVPALAEIERAVTQLGFRGIKIHGGETRMAEYVIDPIFELAASLEVPCLIDYLGNLEHARRIAESFPETTIIVAHFGRYLCTDRNLLDSFIALAEDCGNTILDTSGVVFPWMITEAVRRIGSDRIVFGIDGPHPYPSPVSYARDEIQKIQALPISDSDKQNILWNTIARILKVA